MKKSRKIFDFSPRSIIVLACVLFLVVFGCIMVYSATYYSSGLNGGNKYSYLIKQIIGVLVGSAGLVFFWLFDYQKLKKFKWWAVIISVVLLLLVFVPFIGIENYGARRWIGAFGFSFQPSEIAKFALVLFCACHLSDNYSKVKSFKTLLPVLGVGGLFCVLIILEPNMSITMCVAITLVIMLFVGGISAKHFSLLAVPGVMAVPALIFLEPYRVKRLMAFLDPWASPKAEGFQLIQSLYSLGSGGWFGVGLFNSRQKYLFLPFCESDFIFSIIGEEFGYIGSLGILGVFGFSFQPSEIAKFALVLFCACHLSDNYSKVKSFKTLLPVLGVGGLFCVLIILEPNMSITMCVAITLVIMLFVGGISAKHFSLLAVPGVMAVPALIFLEPYRVKRLMAFLDPWASPKAEGFQLIQSLYSLGSGGWFGVGLFNSRQKYLFLPFCESDFIFSIIGEEFGYIGSLGILGVFALLISMLVKISLNAKDRFGSLLVIGIASVIATQVLINVAVVTGSIPPTGLPLPFISAGSTSLVVFMSAIGVALNVERQSRRGVFV